MHYLVTGHTGFKGAWLCLLLASRGHRVSGLALDAISGSLFETADVAASLSADERVDIRDAEALSESMKRIKPDVVIHLAAQALVRESYRDPITTFSTNVIGTLNELAAVSATPSVRANVVITTDKVYRNVHQLTGYVESDPLGAADPYSSSKAMADLLVQSWTTSFPGTPTAIARAGNVIGGGDVSPDRLLPDLFSSFAAGVPAELRYPAAVRPWQHVLDCLNGYLSLADALLAGSGLGAWNFGPDPESFIDVGSMATEAAVLWGNGASWTPDSGVHPEEAALLTLDSSKAEKELGWRNLLPFPASLQWTVEWQRLIWSGASPADVTSEQIARFEQLAGR